ncbi:MAG: hypothetical protein ACOX2F_00490 [bacterium]
MVTETMVLIAVRQKNWLQVESLSAQMVEKEGFRVMEALNSAAKAAGTNEKAAYLLSLWAGIRWNEINEGNLL